MILQQYEKVILCSGIGKNLSFTCEVLYGIGKVTSGCIFLHSGEDFNERKSQLYTTIDNVVEEYIANNSLSISLSDNLRNIVSNYDFYLLPEDILDLLGDDRDSIVDFSETQTNDDYVISSNESYSTKRNKIVLFAEFESYQDDTEILLSNLAVDN